MNSVEWYAISLGAVVTVFFILRLLYNSPEKCTFVRLRIAYLLIIRRQYWVGVYWGSVTFVQAVVFGVFLAINIFLMVSPDLRLRSGMLASINMVPLFLGGRTSSLANFIGVPLHTYYLAHHWIGRIVVVQGLLHASLALHSDKQPSGIVVLILLAFIFVTSFCFVRESAFQLFLKTHMVLALFIIGGLSWHLLPWNIIKICFPAAALMLWLINTFVRIYRRSFLRGRIQILEITRIYYSPQKSLADERLTAIRITFPSQSLPSGPGSFYYIRFRKQSLLDRFQSHPILVAWWDIDDEDIESVEYNEKRVAYGNRAGTEISKKKKGKGENTVTFLIQAQGSLSEKFAKPISPKSVYLDGPYGQNLQLGRYQTVILVADGIGIAGILPYAQSLAERKYHDYWIKGKIAKNEQDLRSELVQCSAALVKMREHQGCEAKKYEDEHRTRCDHIRDIREELQRLERKLHRDLTRRVDLFWVMEENCQEQWISDRLKRLQEKDIKQQFQVWCYYPSGQTPEPSEEKELLFEIREGWNCFYPKDYKLPGHIEKAIADETRSPGRRIVVACGTATFTQSMRDAVLRKMSPHRLIEFSEVEFQPRDTQSRPKAPLKPKIQPWGIDVRNTGRQLSDLQVSCARTQPEISQMSDSEDEKNIKLKVVPSKKPVISGPSNIRAQVCVVTKSEEFSQFENLVNVKTADFV